MASMIALTVSSLPNLLTISNDPFVKYGLTTKDSFKSTIYKNVYGKTLMMGGRNKGQVFVASFDRKGHKWTGKMRTTEREAALDYDKKMISLGLPPVNILKPKPLCLNSPK